MIRREETNPGSSGAVIAASLRCTGILLI